MDRKSYQPKITKIEELIAKSKEIRKDTILALANAGSGHTGGSLGLADIFTALFFNVMIHHPNIPKWEDRDRLILSIGHVAPVLYASLAHSGYFPLEELSTLRKLGSRLQGHPGIDHGLPGLETSSGSLGQGLSIAVGRALAAKIDKKDWRTYCICGDGELQEGSIWEAAMSASHHKLDNLCLIIDRNGLQIDGKTTDVMEIEPLSKKWEVFGWFVIEIDGHNFIEILNAFQKAQTIKNQPAVIIAKTLMGKGVKSIENNFRWHGKPPTLEEVSKFLLELDQ